MADIKLGQSIAGSLSSTTDPKLTSADYPFRFGDNYYDEYNLQGVDNFRQLNIKLETPASLISGVFSVSSLIDVDLINATTGNIIDSNRLYANNEAATVLLPRTTSPNVNYKIRVSGSAASEFTNGDYKLSIVDGGKATSIVTSNINSAISNGYNNPVGTVGASGVYFPVVSLSRGIAQVPDIALSLTGQLYGVSRNFADAGNVFFSIDPGASQGKQIVLDTTLADTQGNILMGRVEAIEFAGDKLYAIESFSTGSNLYRIDVKTKVATFVGNLPTGFKYAGDLVYDNANTRFLATSSDNPTTDALWQIPIGNPSGSTKIGQIGFKNVAGIDFVNGQLTGFSTKNGDVNQISIDATTGVGTLGQKISVASDISGASTITYPSAPPLNLANFKKDPAKYMGAIRDYDGNNLGSSSTWKSVGDIDINGDGTLENILVNPKIERFASVGAVGGNVDFTKYGLNGDTRVVGIYIDPTLKDSPEKRGGQFDSQRRFQNDLKIENLKVLAAGDYNKDGFQDLYFKIGDGTSVLRAVMFKDGNIQYANYQSKSDLTAFMTANNVNSSVWGNWI